MIPSSLNLYARALADVASQSEQEEAVGADLVAFGELLASHQELRSTLGNPAIPFSTKRRIVEAIGRGAPLSPMVVNLTLVLLERARMHQFDELMAAYQAVLDERSGVLTAEISSCLVLQEEMKSRLQEALSRMTEGKVRINYQQDESLIGGLRLQIGSTIYDSSVRTQLEELRHRLVTQ